MPALTDRELLAIMAAILDRDEHSVARAQRILADVDAVLPKPKPLLRDGTVLELALEIPPRCSRCNGTGILGTVYSQDNFMPASDVYCDCQTGQDLARQNKTKFGV